MYQSEPRLLLCLLNNSKDQTMCICIWDDVGGASFKTICEYNLRWANLHRAASSTRTFFLTMVSHTWEHSHLNKKFIEAQERIRGTRFLSPHLDINLEMSDSARRQQFKYILHAQQQAPILWGVRSCQWLAIAIGRPVGSALNEINLYVQQTVFIWRAYAYCQHQNIICALFKKRINISRGW